jgi:hypothetical protein
LEQAEGGHENRAIFDLRPRTHGKQALCFPFLATWKMDNRVLKIVFATPTSMLQQVAKMPNPLKNQHNS